MATLMWLLLGLCAPVVLSYNPFQVCKDNYVDDCPSWRDRGLCTRDDYKDFMQQHCPKTCGFCGGAKVTAPPTKPPTPPACKDIHPTYCPSWKRTGLCTQDRYKDYMQKHCAKTCDFCGGTVITEAPTQAPTQRPTQGPKQGSCGRPEVVQGRVISGINAARGSWPWQVLMFYNESPKCGGSIISPTWVVTAAHCVSGRESYTSYFKVRVGEHITSTTSDGQHTDISVERIISHPMYSRSAINNDIALIKLSSPIKFGKYVKPVCIPKQGGNVPIGTQCFITGWGKIRHPGSMHHTLQQGQMPVVSNIDCAKLNTKNLGLIITDQMLCAGHGGRTRVSGCHGDSGGPFVCQTGAHGSWELHGVVSWGSGRCDATQGYTVFARVARFRNWIDQQMSKY